MEPATATALTFISAAAAKNLIDAACKSAYKSASGQLRKQMADWNTKPTTPSIYQHVRALRNVKTILQLDRPIDINKFYHPPRIEFCEHVEAITSLDMFEETPGVVIEATVGQGKSILLRFLASKELGDSGRIPIFLELRTIAKGQTVVDCICDEFSTLGVSCTKDVFTHLAKQGNIALYLDAFDEIPVTDQERIHKEIERFRKTFPDLRIIVTSRPGSRLAMSPYFLTAELLPLEHREYRQVLRRVTNTQEVADKIIQNINEADGDIEELLTTPLMVALLVWRYRIDQTVPENTVAFFQSLFPLLLQRHDKLKGGFVRQRTCCLADAAIENIFSTFCFYSRKTDRTQFSREGIRKLLSNTLSHHDVQLDEPQAFIDDVVNITCLILEEGDEYKFIHKGIQEFYSALCISRLPDDHANKFYESVVSKHMQWSRELYFLEQLDRFRFVDVFLRSVAKKMFPGRIIADGMSIRYADLMHVFGDDIVALREFAPAHQKRSGSPLDTPGINLSIGYRTSAIQQHWFIYAHARSYYRAAFQVDHEEMAELLVRTGEIDADKGGMVKIADVPSRSALFKVFREPYMEVLSQAAAYFSHQLHWVESSLGSTDDFSV